MLLLQIAPDKLVWYTVMLKIMNELSCAMLPNCSSPRQDYSSHFSLTLYKCQIVCKTRTSTVGTFIALHYKY